MLFDQYLAAFCTAFSSILSCVQHQNALHLAAYCTAFSSILHCIQRQNALRLAAYCMAFSCKQPQNGRKWRFTIINIHIASIYNYPLFASKQTFARIDFLRQGGRLVSYEGTHNVKICTKNFTDIQEQHGNTMPDNSKKTKRLALSIESTSMVNNDGWQQKETVARYVQGLLGLNCTPSSNG